MTKVMLWPDLYREQGHWLPAVNLAKSLIDAGYTVEFMGIPDCESILTPYNATFRTILADIYPLGHSVENKLEPVGQRWKPAHLLPILSGALDSVFTGPSKPDLLISGYFNALETLLIHYKYDIPFVTLTTYLRHPDEDPASFALAKLIHMSNPLVRKLIDGVVAPEFVGMEPEQFVSPLETQPELIPCAREFDFYDDDWVHSETTHYVEPMIQRAPLDGGSLPQNPSGLYHPIPSDKKIIFGTSGSQVSDYEDKARQFFRSLIAMMTTQGLGNHHLVLAVGDKLFSEFRIEFGIDKDGSNNKLPANVTMTPWISQLEILNAAEVVFMHGGLATIKESIWERVPIVIVPHGKDQLENALRIERAGVGFIPETQNPSPIELKRLLTKATTSPWMKSNLSKMQQVFSSRENASPKPSVSIISGVVAP